MVDLAIKRNSFLFANNSGVGKHERRSFLNKLPEMVKGNFIQELKMAADANADQNGAVGGGQRFSFLGSSRRGSFMRPKSSNSSILTSIKSEQLMDEINEEEEHRPEKQQDIKRETSKHIINEINIQSLDENMLNDK